MTGVAAEQGVFLSPQQIHTAGQEVVREMGKTGNLQMSVMHAYLSVLDDIRRMSVQNGQMWNHMQMPANNGFIH